MIIHITTLALPFVEIGEISTMSSATMATMLMAMAVIKTALKKLECTVQVAHLTGETIATKSVVTAEILATTPAMMVMLMMATAAHQLVNLSKDSNAVVVMAILLIHVQKSAVTASTKERSNAMMETF